MPRGSIRAGSRSACELAEIETERERLLDDLIDKQGKVDERDYDTVATLQELSCPTADDLQGVVEALTDDWDAALARWKTELDGLALDIEDAKKARR